LPANCIQDKSCAQIEFKIKLAANLRALCTQDAALSARGAFLLVDSSFNAAAVVHDAPFRLLLFYAELLLLMEMPR
jgi:hypothetical protein